MKRLDTLKTLCHKALILLKVSPAATLTVVVPTQVEKNAR